MNNITMGKTTCTFKGFEFDKNYLRAKFFNHYFNVVKDEKDFLDNRVVEVEMKEAWRSERMVFTGWLISNTSNITMLSKDLPCLEWKWEDAPEGTEFKCHNVYGSGKIYKKYVVNSVPFLILVGFYNLREETESYMDYDDELIKLSIETMPKIGDKILGEYLGSLRNIW